jgi:hypothetical protein
LAGNEFLRFEKMITPVVIEVLFWVGVVATVIGAIVIMSRGGIAILGGVIFLVLGPLMVRIYCELLILLFRIFESVKNIERSKTSQV